MRIRSTFIFKFIETATTSEQGRSGANVATVPYMLHLASLSTPLCRALTAGLAQALSQVRDQSEPRLCHR